MLYIDDLQLKLICRIFKLWTFISYFLLAGLVNLWTCWCIVCWCIVRLLDSYGANYDGCYRVFVVREWTRTITCNGVILQYARKSVGVPLVDSIEYQGLLERHISNELLLSTAEGMKINLQIHLTSRVTQSLSKRRPAKYEERNWFPIINRLTTL